MDNITETRINTLHPSIRQDVYNLITTANKQLTGRSQIRIVQGLRTFPEQTALYNQGRTTKGKKVTNAKAGQSYHNYGLAIDFALLIDGKEISWDTKADLDLDGVADWIEVVRIFKAAGYTWGGNFSTIKDMPHIEKTFGYSYQELLKKYNAGDFIAGTKYVRL